MKLKTIEELLGEKVVEAVDREACNLIKSSFYDKDHNTHADRLNMAVRKIRTILHVTTKTNDGATVRGVRKKLIPLIENYVRGYFQESAYALHTNLVDRVFSDEYPAEKETVREAPKTQLTGFNIVTHMAEELHRDINSIEDPTGSGKEAILKAMLLRVGSVAALYSAIPSIGENSITPAKLMAQSVVLGLYPELEDVMGEFDLMLGETPFRIEETKTFLELAYKTGYIDELIKQYFQ